MSVGLTKKLMVCTLLLAGQPLTYALTGTLSFGVVSTLPGSASTGSQANLCNSTPVSFVLVGSATQSNGPFTVKAPTSIRSETCVTASGTFNPTIGGPYSATITFQYNAAPPFTGRTSLAIFASGVWQTTGFINPKYIVVGVTYAPPGRSSSVTYGSSTLIGNTTTTMHSVKDEKSFSVSVTHAISAWTIAGGLGIKITGTRSTDSSQTTSTNNTVTTNKTTAVSYQTTGTPNCAPVNHDYDVIWLWVNPLLIFGVYPNTTAVQWGGYGYDNHDPAGTQGRDIIGIQVGWLNGHFGSDPAINAILARSWVSQNETVTWPAGEGPGITSADKANILTADPFTNSAYTLPNPLPSTTSDGRFTQDPYPPNPIGYIPGQTTTMYDTINENTSINSNGTDHTYAQTFATDVNFTNFPTSWLSHFSAEVKTMHTITVDDSWLTTLTKSQTNTNSVSVAEPTSCSPPYSGPGQFILFQDNHYGTFMFYPEI